MAVKILRSWQISLILVLCACSFMPETSSPLPLDEDLLAESESYTAELISEGFEFCPEAYLEIFIDQMHEIPQFNFTNHVQASGTLDLEAYGSDRKYALRAEGEIALSGDGWAGICQFKSSGQTNFELFGRLIPGEHHTPNFLIYGSSGTALTTKPPCGDFGMIPFEEKTYLVIPYQDGGSFEWTWKSLAAGVSGSSRWVLHLPCQ